MTVIEQILDLARWAPSGDNTQPWRFEIKSDDHAIVHGFDTRDSVVYDFLGRASQVSLGALIETISIAGSQHGLRASVERRTGTPPTQPTFDVHFQPDASVRPDPLIESIRARSVQRRRLSTRPLDPAQKSALERSIGKGFRISWLEGFRDRVRTALLLSANSRIRLSMPEAFTVHREVIQWDAQYSDDRIPDRALGLDPLTIRLMKWAMHSWDRVNFLNRYLGGTVAPRVQMDLVPGVACAAHFAIHAPNEAREIDDFVAAGRAVQRFWLTGTQLGLQMQPEYTPLVFASYVRAGVRFSKVPVLWDDARKLTARLEDLLGKEAVERAVFMGRIGAGAAPVSRSLRVSLEKLRWVERDHA